MGQMGNIVRGVIGGFDPIFVPRENLRLDAQIAANLDQFWSSIDTSIDRTITYFERQQDIEMSALYMLVRLYRLGLEPRLAFMEPHMLREMERVNNPHWRYFDPDYDAWDKAALAREQHVPSHPIEVLMLKCLYADRLGLGEEFLWELAATDDGGGYGSTHIVAGGLALKSFSDIPPTRIDAMMQATAPAILRAQQVGRAGDIFAERIMILQWLNRDDQIERAWIKRVLDSQLEDGGWPGRFTVRRPISNQHTACVALAALVQYRAHASGEMARTDMLTETQKGETNGDCRRTFSGAS